METNGAVLTRSSNVFQGMFMENKMLEKSISAKIKYQMQKAKISQPRLAKAIGCSRDRIWTYANGKVSEGYMDIDFLKKLADYFGLDQYYFCNDYHVFVDTVNVSDILKELRKRKGLSQREFAKKMKIPLTSYKVYETGKTRFAEKHWEKLKQQLKNMKCG